MKVRAMQDKYVGDVGDFGKYGLLNEIAKQSGGEIILGINWYYATREEIGNTDGNHIDYLDEKNENVIRYRACFPELYDKLRIIVKEKRRRVYCIENSSILPQNTIFYSRPIPFTGFSNAERSALRKAWFDESLCRLAKADIIFLDPDNGIRPDLARKGAADAIKYVFADEIENYYRQGKSLVIYNHRDRRPKVEYERKLLICRDYVKHPDDIKV
ncbi:MAG: hypothetical protein NTV06_07410, partial [candidate division Zixibacteria bacterium]|nr:hypothetical protein [candidate division Zixibacteria bacterium]